MHLISIVILRLSPGLQNTASGFSSERVLEGENACQSAVSRLVSETLYRIRMEIEQEVCNEVGEKDSISVIFRLTPISLVRFVKLRST